MNVTKTFRDGKWQVRAAQVDNTHVVTLNSSDYRESITLMFESSEELQKLYEAVDSYLLSLGELEPVA